ncbi:MAG: hypothetical protein DCC75_03985 [Proteobacteria bacterium]|nr:MAG: hypothetical protein DCC75_03985 [Pseudomonadota bacterium]
MAATINVDADDVEISISDCGIGIPQGEHGSVFQPYVRGSNAKEHGVRGLGLGLYLAREGLRQTGGRIDAEPGLTVGTVVRISLPQA